MAKLVSKTYGDALFEIAAETGRMEDLCKEAEIVSAVLAENPEISKLMNHPKIVIEEKIEIIENIMSELQCSLEKACKVAGKTVSEYRQSEQICGKV